MPPKRPIPWPRLRRTRLGPLVALAAVGLLIANGVILAVPPVLAVPPPLPAILFLGTSLTAGHGLDPSQAYPALIQARIEAKGLRYRVVNAGVSGETSAGARRRIDWLLRQEIAVLVVETGANDGLRAQDPAATRENIQAILDRARRQTPPPRLVLAGMQALPNYGREYATRFRALYPELAQANRAVLIPFLLEGVAGVPRLNQDDGIHPTAEGHRVIAETVWKAIAPLLREAEAPKRGPA
ncbi:MAG TPA: arylesterase [Vicinamibacteria bacterium]